MIKKFIFLLFFTCLLSMGFACQCIDPPKTFKKSITEHVFEVEILGVDTMKEKTKDYNFYAVVTRLKVIRQFGGEKQYEELLFINGTGADCLRMFYPNVKGDRYIITGIFTEYDPMIEMEGVKRFFVASLCLESILRIEENTVLGNFSKNKVDHYIKGVDRRDKISTVWADRYRKKKLGPSEQDFYSQKLSYKKVIRKIKRKT